MEKGKIKKKEIAVLAICIFVTIIFFAGGCIEEAGWAKNAMFFLSGVVCLISVAGVMAVLCKLGITHDC